MKKLTAWLLIAVMCFSLCACTAVDKLKNVELPPLPTALPDETPAPEPTQTPAEENAAPELPDEPHVLANHVVVGISKSVQEFFDQQNGTQKILTFSYETPAVYIEGREEASEAINEYIARLNETYVTGNDYGVGTADGLNVMLESAQDNYYVAVENNLDLPLEFASEMSVKTKRLDENTVNLVYTSYLFTGGAHGNYGDRAYVFDSETGELLTLEKLADSVDKLTAYLTECMMKLIAEDKDQYYSQRIPEGYLIDMSTEDAIKALVREGSWYFDGEGMCIFSDPYEIGPYASGIIEFHIPYSDLRGHIGSKWIMPKESENGALSAIAPEEIKDGTVEIIDRVVTDESGTETALYADGAIYQVKLSEVEYLDSFYEIKQLWAGSYMKDCVLQIVTAIPDGMPKLMVSFFDADRNLHEMLLTQSGEDGRIILMNKDDIQAQG